MSRAKVLRKAERRSSSTMRRPIRGAAGLRRYAFALTGFSPSSVNAGDGDTLIVANGGPFPIGTTLYRNGVAVPTTRLSSSQLQFTLTSAQAAAGGYQYFQAKQGGDSSNGALFPVNFLVPTLASISPLFAFLAAGATAVTGTGTNIVPETLGYVDGAVASSTPTPTTSLALVVPSSVVDTPGDHAITIANPTPGGGPSVARTFQSRYKAPTLTALSSTNCQIGAGDQTITATVTNPYDAALWPVGSTMLIDALEVPVTVLDATHVRFVIPASVIAVGGAKSVRFKNPTTGGGGGTSSAITFNVGFLAPVMGSLIPSSITASSGATTTVRVLLTNAYDNGDSVVKVNGTPVTTSYIGPGELRFSITVTGTVADLDITVSNTTTGGGGGTSAVAKLALSPDVDTITPDTGYQYDADGIPAKVLGGPFLAGSVVSMQRGVTAPIEVPTTFFDSTRLDILVPGVISAATGNITVRVRNATGRPDSAESVIYQITTLNPLTDLTPPYAGSWQANYVQFDPTPVNPGDIIQAYDIVNGTNPFKNSSGVSQNPTCFADAGVANDNSVRFDGSTEYLGSSTGTNPLFTQIVPTSGDFTIFVIAMANDAANNNTTSANIYNNTQIFASDASPGIRGGLAVTKNGTQMGLAFWMYDGAFKLTPVSTNCAFGAWCYVVIKKRGTTLSISVNGEAFKNTTGVNNLSATTQRTFLATAPPAAGNWKLNGRWHTLISASSMTDIDIMRCQNYAHYGLGIG